MTILAIETATEVTSVALWNRGLIIESVNDSGIQASRVALDMIDKLMLGSQTTWKDITLLAFGHGPGAFTGVRVATGLVQGLSLGHCIPAIGISTLASVALQASASAESDQPVLAVQDARMNELYVGFYQTNSSQHLTRLKDDCLCPVNELILPATGQWLAAGNAQQVYSEQITSRILNSADATSLKWLPGITPRASAIAELAEQALDNGEKPVTAEKIEPVYLRNKVTY